VALTACQTASDSDLASLNQDLAAELDAAAQRIAALEATVASLKASVADHDQVLENTANHLATLDTTTEELGADLFATKTDLGTRVANLETSGDDHAVRLDTAEGDLRDVVMWQADVSPLFDYLTVDTSTDSVVFEGANVFVQSGSGSTDGTVNGLGNLIVGYNEFTSDRPTYQAGSHNIVVGSENGFTSYGSIVSGSNNRTAAPYSAVIGGYSNAATGSYATALGGYEGSVSGDYATIVAGSLNDASGDYSVILGGAANDAKASYSSISGGESNTASGSLSSILGGYKNIASGSYSTIYGGQSQTASTSYAYKP